MTPEPKKACFFNSERPCDLTCKAAFEVDDPVDNIDCSFVWLSFHAGEALFELRQVLENMRGMAPGSSKAKGKGFGTAGPGPGAGPGAGPGPGPGAGPPSPGTGKASDN